MKDMTLSNTSEKVESYRTRDVAKILNKDPQMIRYYCSEFKDYLKIQQTFPHEHRVFSQEHIEKLRYIIALNKQEGLTIKQIKEYISSPAGEIGVKPGYLKLIEYLKTEVDLSTLLSPIIQEQVSAIQEKKATKIQNSISYKSNNFNDQINSSSLINLLEKILDLLKKGVDINTIITILNNSLYIIDQCVINNNCNL